MKNIIISIPNALLASGVHKFLRSNATFRIFSEERPDQVEKLCQHIKPDVLLVEVRALAPYNVDDWNRRLLTIRSQRPQCKVAYIVDENTYPQLAQQVTLAKSDQRIDAFFFSSINVSGEYLVAVIDSL